MVALQWLCCYWSSPRHSIQRGQEWVHLLLETRVTFLPEWESSVTCPSFLGTVNLTSKKWARGAVISKSPRIWSLFGCRDARSSTYLLFPIPHILRLILPIPTYQITIPQFQPSFLALIVLGLTEMLLIFKAYLSLLMLYLVSSPKEYSNLYLRSLQSIVLNWLIRTGGGVQC